MEILANYSLHFVIKFFFCFLLFKREIDRSNERKKKDLFFLRKVKI